MQKLLMRLFLLYADIEKARKRLAYNPKIQFETGIRKFLEWHDEYNK